MISRLLFSLLAFLAPLAFYAAYIRLRRRSYDVRPTALVWTVGAALAVLTFIVAALLDGVGDTPGKYVPSRLENGKVVDDYMERETP